MNQIVNTSLTRRHFVVSATCAAGGLAINVALSGLADAAVIGPQPFGPGFDANDINAFLAISADSSILIRSPHQ